MGKIFTCDSLFYLTRLARFLAKLQTFLAPSPEMSSLSFALLALLRPLLGLDPYYWRWLPILFQIANTLPFYVIGRRILPGKTAALVAAGFWGFRSAAGGIGSDINHFSNFLLAFLLLGTTLLAVEGWLRKSPVLKAGSLLAFILSLLTTEAATTFPLAIWIAVVLADLRGAGGAITWERLRQAVKKSLPLIALFACIDILFAGLNSYRLFAERIHAQDTRSVYQTNLFRDPNLPEGLHIGNAAKNLALAFGLTACVLAIWALDILGRGRAWSWIEGAGLVWFAGLNLPAFMMGQPLAMWSPYIPLFGLALAFGAFAQNLCLRMRSRIRFAEAVPVVLFGALAFSLSVQTRSSAVASDSARQADLLTSFVSDFRKTHAALPANVTLFFLPAFEEAVSQFLSSDLIGLGELVGMYYPGTSVKTLHACQGDQIPLAGASREGVIVFQYLGGRFFDVTPYYPASGTMTLYILPTPEREIAPLLKKVPAGGRTLYARYVRIACADEGVPLPEDYLARRDIWIIQRIGGTSRRSSNHGLVRIPLAASSPTSDKGPMNETAPR
ncbi:MAG: hypothetical protein LAP85_16210 [Acidobacteriia bacterium]|nr:hypothetical protein [Terriglobia bacterium]